MTQHLFNCHIIVQRSNIRNEAEVSFVLPDRSVEKSCQGPGSSKYSLPTQTHTTIRFSTHKALYTRTSPTLVDHRILDTWSTFPKKRRQYNQSYNSSNQTGSHLPMRYMERYDTTTVMHCSLETSDMCSWRSEPFLSPSRPDKPQLLTQDNTSYESKLHHTIKTLTKSKHIQTQIVHCRIAYSKCYRNQRQLNCPANSLIVSHILHQQCERDTGQLRQLAHQTP